MNHYHPKYYGGKDNTYEAIKVIEAWGLNFNLGNVFKYLSRAGHKDVTKIIEDLEKALFYLNREVDNLKCKEIKETKEKMDLMNFFSGN